MKGKRVNREGKTELVILNALLIHTKWPEDTLTEEAMAHYGKSLILPFLRLKGRVGWKQIPR